VLFLVLTWGLGLPFAIIAIKSIAHNSIIFENKLHDIEYQKNPEKENFPVFGSKDDGTKLFFII